MTTIVYAGLGLYILATALYLYRLFRPDTAIELWANRILIIALVLWLGFFGALGSMETWSANVTQRWLWSSAWVLALSFAILRRRVAIDGAGSTIVGLATVLACLGAFSKNVISAPSQEFGYLLKLHIGLAFVGVTAFGFAAAVSALYLIQARSLKKNPVTTLKRRLPPLVTVDRLAFKSILVGFPFYTLALLIGSAFAMSKDEASISISYWMALFSWLVYGTILQARVSFGWRGRRAAVGTLVGLCGVLIVLLQYAARGN